MYRRTDHNTVGFRSERRYMALPYKFSLTKLSVSRFGGHIRSAISMGWLCSINEYVRISLMVLINFSFNFFD